MKTKTTGWIVVAALLFWIVPVCRAGVETVDFVDSSGQSLVRVTFSDPRGEIGVEHLSAFRVGGTAAPGGGESQPLTPRPVGGPLPDHDEAAVRGGLDEDGRFLVDWSGVRVSIEPFTPASCHIALYGLSGTIYKGQAALFDLPAAMSGVAVLNSLKGNADFSISTYATGQTLCTSTLALKHVPDQCGFLIPDCGSILTTMTIVGVARKSFIDMELWVVNAF